MLYSPCWEWRLVSNQFIYTVNHVHVFPRSFFIGFISSEHMICASLHLYTQYYSGEPHFHIRALKIKFSQIKSDSQCKTLQSKLVIRGKYRDNPRLWLRSMNVTHLNSVYIDRCCLVSWRVWDSLRNNRWCPGFQTSTAKYGVLMGIMSAEFMLEQGLLEGVDQRFIKDLFMCTCMSGFRLSDCLVLDSIWLSGFRLYLAV